MKQFRFFFLIILACLLAACNFTLAADVTPPPGYQPPPDAQASPEITSGPLYPMLPPNPSSGETIFAEKCAPCHGATGLGDGPSSAQLPVPVPAIGTAEVAHQAVPAEWFRIVTQGNLERFMPGFQSLTGRQRWDVVAYVLSLSAPAASLKQGAGLYQEKCASCHGHLGKGDGPDAAGLTVPDFSNQELMAGRSAVDLFRAISEGVASGMPAFGAELKEDQSWALTDYLRSLTFATPFASGEATPVPVTAIAPAEAITATAPLSETIPLGTISGEVINASGIGLSTGLTVTLHGFDHIQLAITDTVTLSVDGTYAFENVAMPEGRIFVTTVEFDGLTFGSDAVVAEAGKTTYEIPIQVYETSTDASSLTVDRLHFILERVDADTLRIVELYIISNPGNKTMVAPGEGQAVLSFPLPGGATSLEFQEGALGDRYIKTSDGFGDTLPIRPGAGEYQMLFSFEIPFQRKVELVQPVNLETKAVVILVPEDGIQVKGKTIQDMGTRDVQGVAYHLYNGSDMKPGSELRFTIGGSRSLLESNSATSLVIGLAVLGVVLIAAGVWLYRRNLPAQEELFEQPKSLPAAENAETVMDAILALDDLYQEGKLPEEAYSQRRAELKARLKELKG
jgi:mono/diheme cytochrome c family protein